jgi:hypothetical protein
MTDERPDDWRPIETAPRDGSEILLYWPNYSYDVGVEDGPLIAFGRWKTNLRIVSSLEKPTLSDEERRYLAEHRFAPSYFSASGEDDAWGEAAAAHAPTHWKPKPLPPRS